MDSHALVEGTVQGVSGEQLHFFEDFQVFMESSQAMEALVRHKGRKRSGVDP